MKNQMYGVLCIIVGLIILIGLPNIIYPYDNFDVYVRLTEGIVNALRWVTFSLFMFILGIKLYFKDK